MAQRRRMWTRVPSWRSCVVLAAATIPLAAAVVLLPWPLVVTAALAPAQAALQAGVWAERTWRRTCPPVDDEVLAAHVGRVAARFGLLRRPRVLLVAEMSSPAAAVDGLSPGTTVLVNPQMLHWARQGLGSIVEGVLAHELSHLHRFHVPIRILQRAAAQTATWAWALAAATATVPVVALVPGAGEWGLPTPTAAAAALAATVAWTFVAGVAQSHVCEHDADADAARLGHGPALAVLLDSVQQRRWWRRGLLSHPHAPRRVARLRRPR